MARREIDAFCAIASAASGGRQADPDGRVRRPRTWMASIRAMSARLVAVAAGKKRHASAPVRPEELSKLLKRGGIAISGGRRAVIVGEESDIVGKAGGDCCCCTSHATVTICTPRRRICPQSAGRRTFWWGPSDGCAGDAGLIREGATFDCVDQLSDGSRGDRVARSFPELGGKTCVLRSEG